MSLASNLSLGTAHSLFLVAASTSAITAASSPRVLLQGGSYTHPSTTTSEFIWGSGNVTGNLTNERLWSLVLAHSNVAADVFGYGKTNADVAGAFVASSAFTTSASAFRGQFSGSNDFASSSGIPGGYQSTNTRYPTLLRNVGSRGNGTLFWSGYLYELLVFDSYLDTDHTDIVCGYLHHKWGLQSLLPSGHPYKSSAPTVAVSDTSRRRRTAQASIRSTF